MSAKRGSKVCNEVSFWRVRCWICALTATGRGAGTGQHQLVWTNLIHMSDHFANSHLCRLCHLTVAIWPSENVYLHLQALLSNQHHFPSLTHKPSFQIPWCQLLWKMACHPIALTALQWYQGEPTFSLPHSQSQPKPGWPAHHIYTPRTQMAPDKPYDIPPMIWPLSHSIGSVFLFLYWQNQGHPCLLIPFCQIRQTRCFRMQFSSCPSHLCQLPWNPVYVSQGVSDWLTDFIQASFKNILGHLVLPHCPNCGWNKIDVTDQIKVRSIRNRLQCTACLTYHNFRATDSSRASM